MFAPPGNVAVYFRPSVSLAARRVIGFTAHSVRPGDEPLRAACRAAAQWPDGTMLGVALPPVCWRSPTIGLQIFSAVSESELSPARLELEIPEDALVGDIRPLQQTIEHVRQSGAMVALAGCGRNKAPALPLACFDTIKFGETIVQRLGRHMESDTIAEALIEAASRAGVVTAADGIATEAQVELLTGMGCAIGQGSLFGKPIRAAEIAELLRYPSIAVA